MNIVSLVQKREGGAEGNVPPEVPLCVDLDGTLTRSDTLLEMLVLLIKQQPWSLFLLGASRMASQRARGGADHCACVGRQ